MDAPAAPLSPPPRMLARFRLAAAWWALALGATGVVGLGVAHVFEHFTAPPAFTELEQLIGRPARDLLAPEVREAIERAIGPMPQPGLDGEVAIVRAKFRTGHLGADGVRFTAWGQPVPYQHEGAWYWAVPFRYEAQAGFGRFRADTATALISDGAVMRYLYVPFWNFHGSLGRH